MIRPGWILVSVLALGAGGALGWYATRDAFVNVPAPPAAPTEGARAPEPADGELDGLLADLDVDASRWAALWRLRTLGPGAVPALPKVVALLGSDEPLTGRLAAEALGRMGPPAGAAEEPLRRRWDASNDRELRFAIERAMERIGGWTCFPHEIPEAVSFLEHPFLRVVAEARRRTWLKGEDVEVAARAWRQTQEHAHWLLTDRLYRLGDETLAQAEHGMHVPKLHFESRWSPPFLVCVSDGTAKQRIADAAPAGAALPLSRHGEEPKRFAALLAAVSEVAQAVYRRMLAEHGEALGFRPLEAELGGRPDHKLGERSFPDGFPITLWMWTGPDTQESREADVATRMDPGLLMARRGRLLWMVNQGSTTQLSALNASGARESFDPETAALGIAGTLLEAFGRQANRWGWLRKDSNPVSLGFCALHGGWAFEVGGRLVQGDSRLYARLLREHAIETGGDRGGERWLPLREQIRMTDPWQATHWLRKHGHGIDGLWLHYAQAWALARFLAGSPQPQRREAWTEAVRAVLQRADPADVLDQRLRLDDAAPVAPEIEGEYAAFLDDLAGPLLKPSPR